MKRSIGSVREWATESRLTNRESPSSTLRGSPGHLIRNKWRLAKGLFILRGGSGGRGGSEGYVSTSADPLPGKMDT